MASPARVLILVSDLDASAAADDLDTLAQANAVAQAVQRLGGTAQILPFTTDLATLRRRLREAAPTCVINMVESIRGHGRQLHLTPAVVAREGLACLGADAGTLYRTTRKRLAKRLLRLARIPTPAWSEPPHWTGLDPDMRWIVKSAEEDASHGLHPDSVVPGRDVPAKARERTARYGGTWYAEAFIDGREFNVTLLEGPDGPEILPLAEIVFDGLPPGRPRIVDYEAKWMAGSVADRGTARRFLEPDAEPDLSARIAQAVSATWVAFGLGGWARVDLRVGSDGVPYVIDVNANPDLSPDAGVAAAAAKAGLTYDALIARLLAGARPPAAAS